MDIALTFQNSSQFTDISLNGADLAVDQDLYTAIVISLFSNRRADPDDVVDGDYRGGWWGDSFATVNGFQIGSRLWLLSRQKATQDVANRAQQYCYEALQWLVDQFVVASILVETEIHPLFTLAIGVTVTKPDGTTIPFKFQYVWSQI